MRKPSKKRAPSAAKKRPTRRVRPESIDAYLATLEGRPRGVLERLRATLHAVVPDAEECISYGMHAFRVSGGIVAGFLATAKGYSYFPFSGTTLATLSEALRDRSRTKSALHFTDAAPLSRALVRRLVATRLAEMR